MSWTHEFIQKLIFCLGFWEEKPLVCLCCLIFCCPSLITHFFMSSHAWRIRMGCECQMAYMIELILTRLILGAPDPPFSLFITDVSDYSFAQGMMIKGILMFHACRFPSHLRLFQGTSLISIRRRTWRKKQHRSKLIICTFTSLPFSHLCESYRCCQCSPCCCW